MCSQPHSSRWQEGLPTLAQLLVASVLPWAASRAHTQPVRLGRKVACLARGLGRRPRSLVSGEVGQGGVFLVENNVALVGDKVVLTEGAHQRLPEVGGEPAGGGFRLAAGGRAVRGGR